MYNVFLGPDFELAADCFALNELNRNKLVNASNVQSILNFLSTIPGDPWNYPGPTRVSKLKQCMK
jgi:hypothetical protein